ncbi:MAG: hypothetical protein IJW58_04410 [Clostridia bacterium]|nr:hypothetical protein [Clostridia bacterium]
MKKNFERLKLVILMMKEDVVRTSENGFPGDIKPITPGGNSGEFDTGINGSN